MTTLLHIWEYHYNSNFAAGVRLLEDHGGGQSLTKSVWHAFRRSAAPGERPDSHLVGKLTGALKKVSLKQDWGQDLPVPVSAGQHANPVAIGGDAAQIGPEKITSEKAKALHKEHGHQHALLVASGDDATRAALARDIIERIVPGLDAEYDRLRAGGAPEAAETPATPAEDGAAALRKLQSLRSTISQLKKKVEKAGNTAERVKYEDELTLKIAEKTALENRL